MGDDAMQKMTKTQGDKLQTKWIPEMLVQGWDHGPLGPGDLGVLKNAACYVPAITMKRVI